MLALWIKSYDQPREHIKKQRHYFANKGLSSLFQYSCMDVRVRPWGRLNAKELMLLNCYFGEDSWESLGLQGDQTNQFWRKLVLNIHWKDWCWSWKSNTLNTYRYKELAYWGTGKYSDVGKDCNQEEKGMTEDGIVGCHHWLDMSLNKLQEMVKAREAWHAAVYGVAKSQT